MLVFCVVLSPLLLDRRRTGGGEVGVRLLGHAMPEVDVFAELEPGFVQEVLPGIVDVQSSTLDEPNALPPTIQIQTAERLDWMKHIHELPEFERFPG